MGDVTVRRSPLVGLAVAALLVGAGCARYEDGIGIGKIANVVVQYYRGLEQGNCELARAQLSDGLAGSFRCEEEIKRWPALESSRIAYRSVWTTRVDGDEATVKATIQAAPTGSSEGTACGVPGKATVDHRLVHESDGWRIASWDIDCPDL